MKILKILGVALAIILGCLIVFIISIGIIFQSKNKKEVDPNDLVNSKEFKDLHSSILKVDHIKNIAVLPDKNYIVVDGVVINLLNRTYGKEPELGFYNTYYVEGNKIPYVSIDNLLTSKNILIDSIKVMTIVEKMEKSNITDLTFDKGSIYYRWRVSAMHGEEGIMYSEKRLTKDSTDYNVFEMIDRNFYHFGRY